MSAKSDAGRKRLYKINSMWPFIKRHPAKNIEEIPDIIKEAKLRLYGEDTEFPTHLIFLGYYKKWEAYELIRETDMRLGLPIVYLRKGNKVVEADDSLDVLFSLRKD